MLGISRPGVGSNCAHPTPGKYASTHAWASLRVTTQMPLRSSSPAVKPTTTLAGMPLKRRIAAIAPAKCWQYPMRVAKRNSAYGELKPASGGRSE